MTITSDDIDPYEDHCIDKQKRSFKRKRNIIAKDLRTPKYRMKVIDNSKPRMNKYELLKKILEESDISTYE